MTTTATPTSINRSWVPEPMPVHLVGSIPPEVCPTPGEAMQWCLDQANGAALTALPIDVDPRWIIDWLTGLGAEPGLVTVRAGRSRDYEDMPYYRVAEGHVLSTEDVALRRVAQTADALIYADSLDTAGRTVPTRLQVGIPNPLDLALFAAGSPADAQEWFPVMAQMVREEVTEIAQLWGDRVQFQLETPAVLLRYHLTPRPDWPTLTDELVHQVADVLSSASSVPWVLHLCYGDLERHPLFEPEHLEAPVMFLNALLEECHARDIAMPLVHLPVAHGSAAPATSAEFFTALSRLRRGIDVIAGVVAEDHPAASRTALALFTDALGGPVAGVAAGCGLGRRSRAAAAANIALAAAMAAESSPVLISLPRRSGPSVAAAAG